MDINSLKKLNIGEIKEYNGVLPSAKEVYCMEEDKIYKLSKYKTKPFSYQEEGIQFGLNHDKWLLLDPPGLGKTLQLIYLAEELKKREVNVF